MNSLTADKLSNDKTRRSWAEMMDEEDQEIDGLDDLQIYSETLQTTIDVSSEPIPEIVTESVSHVEPVEAEEENHHVPETRAPRESREPRDVREPRREARGESFGRDSKPRNFDESRGPARGGRPRSPTTHQDRSFGRRPDHGRTEDRRPPLQSRRKTIQPSDVPQEGPFVLYIANLSYQCHEEDIRDFFRNCNVEYISLPFDHKSRQIRGFAHVVFGDRESMIRGVELQDEKLLDRPLRVDFIDHEKALNIASLKRREKPQPVSEADTTTNWRQAPKKISRKPESSKEEKAESLETSNNVDTKESTEKDQSSVEQGEKPLDSRPTRSRQQQQQPHAPSSSSAAQGVSSSNAHHARHSGASHGQSNARPSRPARTSGSRPRESGDQLFTLKEDFKRALQTQTNQKQTTKKQKDLKNAFQMLDEFNSDN